MIIDVKKINLLAFKFLWSFLFVSTFIGCKTEQEKIVTSPKTQIPPLVDGMIDSIWGKSPWASIHNIRMGDSDIVNKHDLSCVFKVVWDKNNCYFLFKIEDDVRTSFNFSSIVEEKYDFRPRETDGVEIFLLQGKDDQVLYNYKFSHASDSVATFTKSEIKGIQVSQKDTPQGYIMEILIPWVLLNTDPMSVMSIPLEVNVIDNDNVEQLPDLLPKKETILSWNDKTGGNPLTNKEIFGKMILKNF